MAEERSLDPLIWKACAGSSVRIPAVGSLVYYFPQGHAEQASGGADLSAVPRIRPKYLCRVAGVQFLASRETDEVYSKVRLDPRVSGSAGDWSSPDEAGDGGPGVASFAKVLSPSDANNGGGFSVPRSCADAVFPPLDYKEDPPAQGLTVRDVHGEPWRFRHIYRGTPRRHLLTTGWSKFVNAKKLVAGDSVVFIKNRSGEVFVGVRRVVRSGGPSDLSQCYSPGIAPPAAALPSAKPGGDPGRTGEAFSRNHRGKVKPESVVEAANLAGMDRPFEVMSYPGLGSSDFVVNKNVVEAAFHVMWSTGTRVKVAVEEEDQSRMTWFQGTVSSIIQHPAPFTSSPWRTLMVTWDEPDAFQNVRGMSPWQVELVSASPLILPPYPIIKKPRIMQNEELLTDGAEQSLFFPTSGLSDTMVGGMTLSAFGQNKFPAGMQGARHDLIRASGFLDFLPIGAHQLFPQKLNCNKIPPAANHVPTELDIGSMSQSESSSPPSQNSILQNGTELFGNSAGKSPSKVIRNSFRLFGKTIHMEPPVVADVKEGFKDNLKEHRSFDSSHLNPQEQVHRSHDGPPQRGPPDKK
uniref:Auxin response factor n=1 Tax=Anthurium amnicola TaxID=1678845 RepID=A0A1D1YCE0_9ARAE